MGGVVAVPVPSILAEPFTSLDDYLAWVERRPAEEHYEVVDGQPVMSPSPTGRHQLTLTNLLLLLHDACPPGHVVLPGPLDWVLWEAPRLQVREPDLVVVPREAADGPRLLRAPLLTVEVLSPSSMERDLVAKRDDYARAGIDHYWVVDPDAPQIAVYRRGGDRSSGDRRLGDRLEIVAQAVGADEIAVDEPVAVRLCPQRLLD